VEYRKQAVAWTLPWSEVRSVEGGGNGCTEVGVLPHAVGLGVAAVEPVPGPGSIRHSMVAHGPGALTAYGGVAPERVRAVGRGLS
jgi:hypothetical protein